MNAVWNGSRHKGGNLLVLLAIADFANDEGWAYPSVATLARKSRMTTRNVRLALNALVASGELLRDRGEGVHGVNLYQVKSLHPENLSGVKLASGGTEKSDREGVKPTSGGGLKPTSPKPSERTVIKKPSGNHPPVVPLGKGGPPTVPPLLLKIIAAWNELPTKPFQGQPGKATVRAFLRIAKEHPSPNVWAEALKKVSESAFLHGHNPHEWQPSLSWFLKPANFAKVLQGDYD